MHDEDFYTLSHIPYKRWDKHRKRQVPCTDTFSVSRIFYSKPLDKIWFEVWIFRCFSFTFYMQSISLAGKWELKIKRFGQFTLARSSNFFTYEDSTLKKIYRRTDLWAGNTSAQNLIVNLNREFP